MDCEGFSVESLLFNVIEMSTANSGICNNCGRKSEELFPVFVEGHTKVSECEYWCKECLMNRK
jgi:hypothetical protein